MSIFNDPSGVFSAVGDWSGLDHYQAAVDALEVVQEPSWRERVIRNLHAIAVTYSEFRPDGGVPTTSEINTAVVGIIEACQAMDRHLEILLRAGMLAPPNVPDRADVLRALYAHVVTILFPELATYEWDREGTVFDAPGRLEFTRRAKRMLQLVNQLDIAELPTTNRPVDPTFDQLICHLATVYSQVRGEAPSAPHKGAGAPEGGYRSRFAAFVAAFWPALNSESPVPGNGKIAAALQRSGY